MRKLKKPDSLIAKLTPNTKKKLVLALLVVIVFGLIIFVLISILTNNPNHKITQKIDRFNKEETPCEQVVKEIGSESADSKYTVDVQKELLEKQMLCLSDRLEFDRAIAVAEKLQVIYAKENDSTNEQRVQLRIKDMKATQEALKASDQR